MTEPINLTELRKWAERTASQPDSTYPHAVLALIDVAEAAHKTLSDLERAEQAARIAERNRNEGDADAIRRDAIRSIIGSDTSPWRKTPLADALARFTA